MTKDFDSNIIRTLADILKEANLSEVEYEGQYNGQNFRIKLGKQYTVSAQPITHHLQQQIPDGPAPQPIITTQPPSEDHLELIKSPIVGTAYLSSQPGAAPFIKVGDIVQKGSTLLIIEAMKVMNAIKAPVTGIIRAINVNDTKPVEFGEILIKMEKQG